ncbi:hypothetical protein [Anabaena sp. UHCC 0187]|uniref:hypothetical protein n=1 Tax=Anabaena sp. UHCC 0187 TaxID=2590018 RepID=UPI0014486994|nr:hypothetical protein [Anabaena sp. UHCC 0187]
MEVILSPTEPRRIKPPEPNLTLVNELFPDFANVKINYQELGKELEKKLTTKKK